MAGQGLAFDTPTMYGLSEMSRLRFECGEEAVYRLLFDQDRILLANTLDKSAITRQQHEKTFNGTCLTDPLAN